MAGVLNYINSNGVQSDRGFVVQCTGRFSIEYNEGSRKITVLVERGMSADKLCVTVDSAAFQRWDDDPDYVVLPPEKQDEMLANFTEAMEFQGIAVIVL